MKVTNGLIVEIGDIWEWHSLLSGRVVDTTRFMVLDTKGGVVEIIFLDGKIPNKGTMAFHGSPSRYHLISRVDNPPGSC